MKSPRSLITRVLAGVVLLGLGAVALVQHRELAGARLELGQLRQELGGSQRAQVQREPVFPGSVDTDELERLRNENRDLLRLRNEVRQLREQQQELEKLRAANAQLLQAYGRPGAADSNSIAALTNVRRRGAVLGITIVPEGNPPRGAVVQGIDANSPVSQSGLRVGDVIVAVDGRPVSTGPQVQSEMLTRQPGQTVLLDVARGNEVLRIPTQTRAWPE
jgi:predicted metalloprotease with PDZ domain